MLRKQLPIQYATCHKGINQQVELASLEECADARNVWAPDGRVVSRPGFVGITNRANLFDFTSISTAVVVKESPIGTFTTTNTLDNLAVGRRWYVLFADAPPANCSGFVVGITNGNGNDTWAAVEYWNGVSWAPIYGRECTNSSILQPTHLNAADRWLFPMPTDLAQATVNSATGYGFRFTIERTALDASVSIDPTACFYVIDFGLRQSPATVALTQFPYTKRYLNLDTVAGGTITWFLNTDNLSRPTTSAELVSLNPTPHGYLPDEPPTIAVVPQFEEAYLAYNRTVTVHKAYPSSTDDVTAVVEDDPLFVGPSDDPAYEPPYDKDQIAQLAAWPRAKYLTFYRDRLWAANLDDSGDYSIRWSAPIPYYKIWPTDNIEVLMENDNSPITALMGYQQNMTVFKEDSIWQMVDSGISDFNLQTYAPQRVVSGVGCASQSSIVEVQGRLIFLAEDGVYAYDGTPNIQKLSYRIQDTINSITPARRKFACGVNWSQKNLYLLAVSVDGSDTNNLILVWDYKNDVWWLWNSIEAQNWVLDEGANDLQELFFVDSHARVFQLGVGNLDNGAAISSTVKTHRFEYGKQREVGGLKQRVRMVEILSTNESGEVEAEVFVDDAASGPTGAIELIDSTEAKWPSISWGQDNYVTKRRRRKRLMFRADCQWAQIGLTHSTKNTPFELGAVGVGFIGFGRR